MRDDRGESAEKFTEMKGSGPNVVGFFAATNIWLAGQRKNGTARQSSVSMRGNQNTQ